MHQRLAETLPGFESDSFYGLVAPPRTPRAIVEKINLDINEALHRRDLLGRLAALSAEPVGGTPEQADAYMRREATRWAGVIASAAIRLE
jgi:tripartite-type tricarboxylate transporter receptor subunit TctC